MDRKMQAASKKAVRTVLTKGKSKKQVMAEFEKTRAPQSQKMYDDLMEVIDKYYGKLKMVEALGVLLLVQDEVKGFID